MKARKERHCLKCDISFISAGPENRLCHNCRFVNTYRHMGGDDTEECIGCNLYFAPYMMRNLAGYRICVNCLKDMEVNLFKGVPNA